MYTKPIFVATHPRACSTAFERVFMTRRDTLQCAHEPFGDAFYYGPERLSSRYEDDEEAREATGFSGTTYSHVLDRLDADASDGKRVFIKDMAYYLMPPNKGKASPAPSVVKRNAAQKQQQQQQQQQHPSSSASASSDNGGNNNPTVLPLETLRKFHFAFLIRHPRRGIPSFYRCCVPPLDDVTGFKDFMPQEAGYAELVRMFDYLREQKLVGPALPAEASPSSDSESSGEEEEEEEEDGDGRQQQQQPTITVIDADDLLDKPREVIEVFCRETGIQFTPDMLSWDDPENQRYVSDAFAKWVGFHNDAINSTKLSARTHARKTPSVEEENEEWRQKYGEEAQKVIRACVDENTPHYEYLKSFAIKV